MRNKIRLGTIAIFSLCIILFFAYKVIQISDQKSCYSELANQQKVSASYKDVGEAFLFQIRARIQTGTEEKEVIENISQIAPVTIINGEPGDKRKEITLNLCKIPENNFHYLLSFEDRKFVDIVLGSFTDW